MLQIRGLSKRFESPSGEILAVQDLNLTVNQGKFFVLLGPSGCGKSTLLRCIAGLEPFERGEIQLDGRILSSAENRFFTAPEDREVAMVFQSYAVWPHMTVFENVAFPLTEAKRKRASPSEVKTKVKTALELVRMSGFEMHPAANLSGGQQQRVALARALIREPKLLLMDEPLSNLDAKLREEMRDEIKDLTRRLGVTTLHVTHDQTEAMALADVLAVMSEGCLLELGAPEELYRKPGNRVVAEFLGRTNWLSGTVKGPTQVETSFGVLDCSVKDLPVGLKVLLGIRPEWIELKNHGESGLNCFAGTIVSRSFLGEAVLYWVSVGGTRLLVKTNADLPSNAQITAVLPPERWVAFPEAT